MSVLQKAGKMQGRGCRKWRPHNEWVDDGDERREQRMSIRQRSTRELNGDVGERGWGCVITK